MRALFLAPVVVAMLIGPAVAQTSGPEGEAYRAFPCKSFVSSPNGKSELAVAQIMADQIAAKGAFAAYPSYCVIVEEVRAECRLDTRYTLGDAVDRLYAKQRNGIALPNKRACGA